MPNKQRPFGDHDVEKSLQEFRKKLNESYTVPIPERVEGSQKFIQAVQSFASSYGVKVDINEGLYFKEAIFREMGGPYPKNFCRDFTRLLAMGDRFDITGDPGDAYRVTIAIQFDTHDYYFNGRKFNENW